MGEKSKFLVLRGIVPSFTEKNKKNLLETAKHLLVIQRESKTMLADALPQSERRGRNEP